MLKMSTCVAAPFVAGLISLACSSSGLKTRGSSAGAGSLANGGQAGSGRSLGSWMLPWCPLLLCLAPDLPFTHMERKGL